MQAYGIRFFIGIVLGVSLTLVEPSWAKAPIHHQTKTAVKKPSKAKAKTKKGKKSVVARGLSPSAQRVSGYFKKTPTSVESSSRAPANNFEK